MSYPWSAFRLFCVLIRSTLDASIYGMEAPEDVVYARNIFEGNSIFQHAHDSDRGL